MTNKAAKAAVRLSSGAFFSIQYEGRDGRRRNRRVRAETRRVYFRGVDRNPQMRVWDYDADSGKGGTRWLRLNAVVALGEIHERPARRTYADVKVAPNADSISALADVKKITDALFY